MEETQVWDMRENPNAMWEIEEFMFGIWGFDYGAEFEDADTREV